MGGGITNLAEAKSALDSFLTQRPINYAEISIFLKNSKQELLAVSDQVGAKNVWILETILSIQQQYLAIFTLLKKKEYYKAWQELECCGIKITALSRHYDYKNDKAIFFIDRYVKKYQSLYPYKLFSSIEMIHDEVLCSICKKRITPRSFCGHINGEIYDGELCYRIITKAKVLGISIVNNPVHKSAVFFPGNESKDTYNYDPLDYLLSHLNSPFSRWDVSITKKECPINKFYQVKQNDPCPCGSKKKYQNCCINNKTIVVNHYYFTLEEDS